MIYFEDWNIRSDGSLLARQHDHLSRKLAVAGNFPAGWQWEMLIQVGDAMDIIALNSDENGIGALLTEDQLSLDGYYKVQLRGRKEDTVCHTNVLQILVPESLSGTGRWPEVPSAFLELEQRIAQLNRHPPIAGEDGYWRVWNTETGEYVKSELVGPSVLYTAQELTALQQAQARENIGSERIGACIPVPVSAECGQTISVSEVDEHGRPVAWKTAEKGWEIITDRTIQADGDEAALLLINQTDRGEEFAYREIVLTFYGTILANAISSPGFKVYLYTKSDGTGYLPSDSITKLPVGGNAVSVLYEYRVFRNTVDVKYIVNRNYSQQAYNADLISDNHLIRSLKLTGSITHANGEKINAYCPLEKGGRITIYGRK